MLSKNEIGVIAVLAAPYGAVPDSDPNTADEGVRIVVTHQRRGGR